MVSVPLFSVRRELYQMLMRSCAEIACTCPIKSMVMRKVLNILILGQVLCVQ